MLTSAFVIETELMPDQVQALKDRLYAFNLRAAGLTDGQGLAFYVRDERGRIVAGSVGTPGMGAVRPNDIRW